MGTALLILLETLYDCHVSGIILIGCDYLSIRSSLNNRIPHVWIDCNDAPEDTQHICQVQSDQYVAGQMAADLFFRKGSRRPLVFCGSRHTHRDKDRISGFCSVYENKGYPVSDRQICFLPEIKPHVVESQDMVRYLLTKGEFFDGIFAISDGRAIGAYLGLREHGIRIPEAVKLMAFDGIAEANVSVLNITSIHQNVNLITRRACETFIELIKGNPIEEKRILVPTDILSGQTV